MQCMVNMAVPFTDEDEEQAQQLLPHPDDGVYVRPALDAADDQLPSTVDVVSVSPASDEDNDDVN